MANTPNSAKVFERQPGGYSMLEMLVAVVVTGIAIAGLGEMLWINGAFSNRIFNKMDNIGAAKVFLEILGKDVRTSVAIGNQQILSTSNSSATPTDTYIGGSSTFELSNSTLILQIPYAPQDSTVAAETYAIGYPLDVPVNGSNPAPSKRPVLDTVIYQADLGAGTITRYFFPDPFYAAQSGSSRVASSTVVLNNLVGPTDANTYTHVFDYVTNKGGVLSSGSQYPFQSVWTSLSQINSVMVNLELKSSATASGTYSNSANVGLRREFFMRNYSSQNGYHS